MASVVDICNMALSHLGSRAQVSSIDPPDGSVEAGLCARFYSIARKEALEAHKWTWSKKREALAVAVNPSTVWAYAYALPSDCLSPARVMNATLARELFTYPFGVNFSFDDLQRFTERGSAEFEVEGQTLLTHEPDAVLLYTRDIIDTTKFSAAFTTFFSYLLAAYLAGPIVKGEAGARAALRWREIARKVKGDAAADDANGSVERADHIPEFMQFRQ